jgi:hypothetical protein
MIELYRQAHLSRIASLDLVGYLINEKIAGKTCNFRTVV